MTPVEHLRAAKALLEDPAHWCQGSFARDKDGFPAPMNDRDTAVSWCAMGALYAQPSAPYGRLEAFKFLSETIPTATVHAALLAWFDRAIALAEAP
jgi:hypothetical protein